MTLYPEMHFFLTPYQAKRYPFLSTSIFSNTSTPGNPIRYNQTAVFGTTFTLNNTALEEHGLPRYAGSYVWTLMATNWAVSTRSTHSILTNFADVLIGRRIVCSRCPFLGPTCHRLHQALLQIPVCTYSIGGRNRHARSRGET
jgi:hypothetical protein